MTASRVDERTGAGRGLALIGYRGSGKSCVGLMVAERAGAPFVDMDTVFEQAAGCSIAEFLARESEEKFRDIEQSSLREQVAARRDAVIATGGGAVVRSANCGLLRAHGLVVWLEAMPTTLAKRLRADPGGRPSLTGRGLIEEIDDVLKERTFLYSLVADLHVRTDDRTISDISDEVAGAWSRWRNNLREFDR